MKTTVVIAIHYISQEYESKVLQRGEFKLRGKKPEEVALQYWKQIKRESSRTLELEQVICDGEDITELVNNLIDDELGRLPFQEVFFLLFTKKNSSVFMVKLV